MSNSLRPHGLQHARPPVHHELPEFTQTHVCWAGVAIQPPHPLSSPSPPAFNLSQDQGIFQWVSSFSVNQVFFWQWVRSFSMSQFFIRWPKYCSFSFSISPSNDYSGLISFRIDWFYLLAVQEILKSLLQHYSSKVSILRLSAFFGHYLLLK